MPVSPDLLRRLGLLGLGMTVAAHFFVLYDPSPSGVPAFPHIDKVIHVAVFAAPVVVALFLGFDARLVPLVFALHAPVSELVQHFFLPGRTGDVLDVVADLVGVGLGVLVARALLAYPRWRLRRSGGGSAR